MNARVVFHDISIGALGTTCIKPPEATDLLSAQARDRAHFADTGAGASIAYGRIRPDEDGEPLDLHMSHVTSEWSGG